jgi:hypothetical protein
MNATQSHRPVKSILSALAVFAISALALNSAGANNAAPAGTLSNTAYLPVVKRSEPGYDWLQFNGDARHSGSNTLEKIITPTNVNKLSVLFQTLLPDVADGAPVSLANVPTATGVRDLIFATTRSGGVVALDALTGATVWVQLSRAAPCLINNDTGRNEACYTTASPVIDPGRQYVYSYGLDGYVHKYAVGNGAEVVTGGWPELTSRKVYDEKGSSALGMATLATGTSYLYVAHGGYPGDAGNYQGHLTAINLSDGTQKVFNTLCSNQAVHFVDSRTPGGASGPDCYPNTQSAIWARAGVVYDSDNNRLYLATGNGPFAPGQFLWGDTVLAINPDGTGVGTGNPLDSYTPTNFQSLANADLDLGSTAPGLLPPAGGKYPHLAVQGGKDGVLRLINLDNLSGRNQVGLTGGEVFSMLVPMGGGILTQPGIWVNPADNRTWVFVSNSAGLAGLQLVVNGAGNPSLQSKWTAGPGTSPIVANGVLFYASSGLISALDPTSGILLWSDNQIGGIHWESPIVANGVLYLTDQNKGLTAYSLH